MGCGDLQNYALSLLTFIKTYVQGPRENLQVFMLVLEDLGSVLKQAVFFFTIPGDRWGSTNPLSGTACPPRPYLPPGEGGGSLSREKKTIQSLWGKNQPVTTSPPGGLQNLGPM